jgi:hypothetical protein
VRTVVLVLVLVLGTFTVGAQASSRNSSSESSDAAIAKRVVLRVTDFPAGWSRTPDGAKDTGCFSGALKRHSPTAFVEGPRVSTGENGTDASQSVVVYGTRAGARRALTAVTASSVFACYRAKIPAILKPAGLKMESFTGGQLSFDRLGDVLKAYRYKVALSKSGDKAALFLDYVFVLRGRVLVSTGFVGAFTEPDVFVEHSVLAKVVARTPPSG